MADCDTCLLHAAVDSRLKAVEDDQKEVFGRLKVLEVNEGRRGEKIDNLIEVIKDLKNKIDTLTQLPSQRWNLLVTVIITAIVTSGVSATVTYIITKLVK